MEEKTKFEISWRHPNLRDYRLPLFDYLNCKHNVFFLLTRSSKWDGRYNHFIYGGNKHLHEWIDFHSFKNLFTYLAIHDYDILISSFLQSSYTLVSTIVAKLRRKKVIIWEEKWIKNTGMKSKIIYFLIKHFLTPFIDAFFVCGLCQKKYLKSLGAKPDSLFVANESSMDLSKINVREMNLGPDVKDKKIVLFIGRIIEKKGLTYLIKAFSTINETNNSVFLLIVGDGHHKSKCVELAKDLKLTNCKFIGRIDDIRVKSYIYNMAYVVVVPSIVTPKQTEGGPIVVPEALSTGTPLIVSDAIGSSLDLITDGVNGYVVEQKNSEDLADKISLILDNKLKYESFCKSARLTYEEKCDYRLLNMVFTKCIYYANQLDHNKLLIKH